MDKQLNNKENETLPKNETVQEFAIRISNNTRKKHHIMSFNGDLNFNQWYNVQMSRENNTRDDKSNNEKMPKFGAGSEYNRELKEKIRRNKFRSNPQKNRQDNQPWILKAAGNQEKIFRSTRRGGVSEHASYYVFTQNSAGHFDASPLHDWYDFKPEQRYKALSAEQAEKEFGRRDKILNYFSVMAQNRLHESGEKEAKVKTGKELIICDDKDVFMDTESDSDTEGRHNNRKTFIKTATTKIQCKKRKRSDSEDDDAFEESDGDKEGHEVDYGEPSESDESDIEAKNDNALNSVAEETGEHQLLSSDEESLEEDLLN